MDHRDVPYIVFEGMAARFERIIARLWVLLIILALMLVGTNLAWIYYENQFEDVVTTIEAEQEADNGGSNFVVNGYGETEGQDNN